MAITLLLNIWSNMLELDRKLFIKLNQEWTNPVFDVILPWLRHSAVWAPLYIFILLFVVINFKSSSIWWIVLFLGTVALTDMIGTYVFKHNIERLRPCRDPEMFSYVRLLVRNCAGGYSFTSNHAANHFGMGVFFFITMRKIIPKWAWLGLAWAALICYAQVYVGVHYPFDVLGGALLGLLAGSFTGLTFNKRFGFAIFDNQSIAMS